MTLGDSDLRGLQWLSFTYSVRLLIVTPTTIPEQGRDAEAYPSEGRVSNPKRQLVWIL